MTTELGADRVVYKDLDENHPAWGRAQGDGAVLRSGFFEPARNSESLLAAYEDIRHLLPTARYPARYQRAHDLEPLTDRYDAFFFDAFGVLNIGDTAIDKAAHRVSEVRRSGRHVRIVSNAASAPVVQLHQKYTALGFDFKCEEIITSRVALIHYLRNQPARHWGVMAPAGADLEDLGVDVTNLAEQPDHFDKADGFILLSATGWTDALFSRLLESLKAYPRPILLANPDLAAPMENGFSIEPGKLAHALRTHAASTPIGFGKPYRSVFEIALSTLPQTVAREKVLMIGDTLHTDVLGGCSAGLNTALVTANGVCASLDWVAAIRKTAIVPHHVLDHI